MSNIIIVGNGSSLLNKEDGNKIDSFDTVVRFNSYKIKGFEKHVGTKTDIWFTVNGAHFSELKNYKEVIIHTWEWNKDKCKLYQKFLPIRDCKKTERQFVRSKIPCKNPSTGLIAIYYFLEKYDIVTITGFDWWENEKHHYGDNEVRGTLHSPKEEYEILKNLIKENRLEFL